MKEATPYILAVVFFVIVIFMAVPTLLRGNCIVKGARIATPTGDMLIENLKLHDEVLTQNLSGHIEPGVIVATRESTARSFLNLRLANGTSLNATPEHPLATPTGWRNAGALKIGDTLITQHGTQILSAITTHYEHVQVYDLTVHPNPNFFANGILVHNKTRPETAAANMCQAAAEAQAIYHRMDYDKDSVIEYAQNVRDLLETKPGTQNLQLIDPSMSDASEGTPRHGYLIKVLTSQGSHAKGGKMSYIENSNMTRGFAILVYPAGSKYNRAFMINHDGTLYEKEFTLETLPKVHDITEFDPDTSWKPTE